LSIKYQEKLKVQHFDLFEINHKKNQKKGFRYFENPFLLLGVQVAGYWIQITG